MCGCIDARVNRRQNDKGQHYSCILLTVATPEYGVIQPLDGSIIRKCLGLRVVSTTGTATKSCKGIDPYGDYEAPTRIYLSRLDGYGLSDKNAKIALA